MRILVTGGSGFLGAWIIRRLAAAGCAIRIFDRNCDPGLVRAIAGAKIAEAAEWRSGDIASPDEVLAAAAGCDGIVHLAGILTPDCKVNPLLGAQINLIGTLNVFAAAKARGIERIVYAGSAGVYAPNDGRRPRPITHYGSFKLACEGSARAFWVDDGIASIGFRPNIVYGPGRETGRTAGPSLACRAAARGEAYDIPYSGAAGLVHVDDVAAAFEAALMRTPDGAHVFNLPGKIVSIEQVIDVIHEFVPAAQIGINGPAVAFASDIEEENLNEVLPGLPRTPLHDGIRDTIEYYRGKLG